jgi:hypothetical protein
MAQTESGGIKMNLPTTPSFDLKNEASELADRFLIALELTTPARGGFSFLESKTGVSYERWRNVSKGRQAPSIELLLALCHIKPEWSLWILTGQNVQDNSKPSESDMARAIEIRTAWAERGSK